jgi:CheY-like chemotaxis protein
VANNGKEALGILGNSVSLPDLIFLDINMPVMNGLECLIEIVKNPRTNTIPVVILSSAFEQAEHSRKLGAKGFIKKSPDLKELRTELHRIITLKITVNYLGTNPGFIASPEKTNYEKA